MQMVGQQQTDKADSTNWIYLGSRILVKDFKILR